MINNVVDGKCDSCSLKLATFIKDQSAKKLGVFVTITNVMIIIVIIINFNDGSFSFFKEQMSVRENFCTKGTISRFSNLPFLKEKMTKRLKSVTAAR